MTFRKTLIGILAVLVAFVTVFSLVLPAVALTNDAAHNDSDINLGTDNNSETQTDNVSKDNTEPVENNNQETVTGQNSVSSEEEKEPLKFYGEAGDSIVYVEAPYGAFDEEVTMEVKEVILNSEQYDSINDQVKDKTVKVLKALDIIFRNKEGKEVEPKENSNVKVSITNKELSDLDNAFVAHIDEKEESPSIIEDVETKEEDIEVLTNTEEITEIVENNESIDEITVDNTVTFETDSFSLYVLAYTVDFHTKDKDYSIPGNSQILLSELIEVMEIKNSDGDVIDVKEVNSVSFSDEKLVKVEEVRGVISYNGVEGKDVGDKDFLLTSLEPFSSNEKLIIVLLSGEIINEIDNNISEIIEIDVTDSQTSSNLSDFITNVNIVAPTNSEGQYVVEPGTRYSINLSFKETPSLQFNNSSLTYTIPQGLNADGSSGEFTVIIKKGGVDYPVSGNTFSVENGVLTVNWNKNSPNYDKLTASGNVSINFSIEGVFSENANKIEFSDSIKKDIIVDTSNSVSTAKYGNVSISDNKIYYTATVTSSGTSNNVVVRDTITGNAVTLNSGSITATSSTGQTVQITPTVSGNSFQVTIPSMRNGEIITLSYFADIDPTKISMNDGKIISQAGNTFSAKSDGDPEGDNTSVTNTIDYTPKVSKSNGTITGSSGTKQKLKWSLTVNEDKKVSAAGTLVTDTIDSNSQSIMKYSGTGITVKVYDTNNNLVRTDSVLWAELNSHSDSSWTFLIPSSDSSNKYKYVIEYETEVETKDLTSLISVNNIVTTNGGSSSSGSGQVPPGKEQPEILKSVSNIDKANKEIEWTITFTVPKNGLTKAVVTDTYPNVWINNVHHFEKVKNSSVYIVGLLETESYTLNFGDEAAVITFTNNGSPGLAGNGVSTRTITITLKTQIDDDWVEMSKTEAWMVAHQNKAELDYGTKIEKSATANLAPNKIDKSVTFLGNRTVDGVDLPIYKYAIVLLGVDNDNFTIEDVFNTQILELYSEEPDPSNPSNCYLFGGDQYYQGTKGINRVSYVNSSTGITFQITPDSLPKNNGDYYTGYKLVYYLTVKDATALNKLAELAVANNDNYTLNNTATWNGETDSAPVVYSYKGLTKEILTSDEDLKKTDTDIFADFRITLNPSAQVLNNGDPLTMTDTVSNLSVDITSIVASPSSGVSWDMSGNTVTYIIPDATKVVITYRARVIYTSIGESGQTISVNFSNSAQMKGYSDEINKTAERKNSGQGQGTVASINLMKYKAGDMTQRLQGAEFTLLDSNRNPVKDKYNNFVVFVTDSNGMINVEGDADQLGWFIEENKRYYLRETKAPSGYMLSDFDYSFLISEDGTTNYSEYIYHSGDTMTAKNYPGTDVKIEKVWSDGNNNHNNDNVTIRLQQAIEKDKDSEGKPIYGTWNNTIRKEVEISPKTYEWQDVSSITKVLDTNNEWQDVFTSLPLVVPSDLTNVESSQDLSVIYRVIEIKINDTDVPEDSDSVTITEGTDGGSYSFVINNKVDSQLISIYLRKIEKDSNPIKPLANAEFTLYKYTDSSYNEYDREFVAAPKTTLSDGELEFDKLTEGYYELVETHTPDGYKSQ